MTYRALELQGPFKRHPSPGKCIYCGDTTSPRTEEHVLPYAIAGNMLVFEDACCPTCQKKILEFEQPTLQESFKHVRYKIGAPSRSKSKGKKKKKAKKLPTLDSGHVVGMQIYVTEQTQLSQLDHPIGFIGLRLTPPKILQGITVLADAPVDGFGAIDQGKLKQFTKYNNSIISIAAINPSFLGLRGF